MIGATAVSAKLEGSLFSAIKSGLELTKEEDDKASVGNNVLSKFGF